MCNAQDANGIADAQRSLSETQQKLAQILLMLPACEKGSGDVAKLKVKLKSVAQDVRDVKDLVDVIETEVHQLVKAGFADLKVRDDITWRVALRHYPFFATLPEDVEITSESQSAIIKKKGNSIDRPIAPSSSYHVCPDCVLTAGDRVKLRISIPSQPSRGGTPVPYFGFRDTNGTELVLGNLIDDNKVHEILVQCLGSDGFASYDGVFANRYGVKELVPPVYIFFHMNDTSELKIHEFRLTERSGSN